MVEVSLLGILLVSQIGLWYRMGKMQQELKNHIKLCNLERILK